MVKKESTTKNGAANRIAANNQKAIKPETKAPVKEVPVQEVVKVKTLDERLTNFEKMKGLASQRERLAATLGDLNKFRYRNSDSCAFLLRDENGKEFKTTNNNLIQLVTDVLQEQLTTRKTEIEKGILEFDM